MANTYIARFSESSRDMSPEMRDLLHRRTAPFLDSVGISKPIGTLLEEAYLQGMKDAIQCMCRTPPNP